MAERKTENLLEQALRTLGFSEEDFQFQGSSDKEIQRCLPSKKSGKAGKGKPEHIIRLNGEAAYLLITECKQKKSDHASAADLGEKSKLRPVEFAEDGVIHYMKGLREEFNVIGLAVSGKDDLRISTFRALRGGEIERLPNKNIVKKEDYLAALQKADSGKMTESEIKAFIRELHNYLRDKMELSETLKPLIVSGILLSLKHTPFERSYKDYADKNDLASAMYQAIEQVLGKAGVKGDKFKAMMSNYAFIKTNKAVKKHLPETISKVSRCLAYALRPNSSLDLLGNFYGEFLRYSGGDKKGLGIVLTPRHVTELFADLADLDPKQSVVLDVCAGTGGFLISAMANMVAKSANDSATIQAIKDKRLIGIETDSHMFTLACANMIFKGDGKSNMFFDDCLNPEKDEKTIEIIGKLKPNVGLLNPPYSKKEEDKAELCFVKRALDLLEPRGTCIAILPISCLIDDSKVTLEAKKDLLASHSLKAVMSMPGQLFPNVGTVTAIAVFEAHKPHCNADGTPKAETWLAYWHDDGYSLLKKDRIERKPGIWAEIKKNWLDDYFKQRVVLGSSYKKGLTGSDEWVAEAFMETDYAKLGKADFEEEVKKFALFKLSSESKPDTGGVE